MAQICKWFRFFQPGSSRVEWSELLLREIFNCFFLMALMAEIMLIWLGRCALISGFPFLVCIINLPQRLQIVNGKSPIAAGVEILPLLLLSAVGSGVGGAVLSKKNLAFYLLVTSNVFQVLGTGLLSSLPTSQNVPVQIYPYMAMLGLGFGLSVVSMMVLIRTGVAEEDQGSSAFSSTPSCAVER